MSSKSHIVRYLSLAVFLLLLGVAVAPSINANVRAEYVEVTTELIGIDSQQVTALLTRQQTHELDVLFADIKLKLDEAESIEEKEKIFKDALIPLDRLGLLGKLNIEQAEEFVFSSYQQHHMEIYDSIIDKNNDNLLSRNYFCLIAGRTNYTYSVHRLNPWILRATWLWAFGAPFLGLMLIEILPSLEETLLYYGFLLWMGGIIAIGSTWSLCGSLTDINPISFFNVLGIGFYHGFTDDYIYSNGWCHSIGALGDRSWDGELLGNLPGSRLFYDQWFSIQVYPAMWGFNGFKFGLNEDGSEKYYLGSALVVGMDTKENT